MLERAQKHVSENNNPIRHVWLVYDQDDFPRDNFDNTARKCTELTNQNLSKNSDEAIIYHALWSNQCIELWFLLHFTYSQSDLHRKDYPPMLNTYLCNIGKGKYKKNRDDIYAALRPFLKDAIRNAKSLRVKHNNDAPSKNTPGTNVFEIFEFLSVYLNETEGAL